MTNLLSVKDFSKEQLLAMLSLAIDNKQNPAKYAQALAGKNIATIYEKPSLRTRVSFEVGINKLGGHCLYLDQQNGAMGKREPVKDFASNLSCWVDAIVARVFDHNTLIELTEHASVPVVNALCDLYHPCQALADFMSLMEVEQDLSKVSLAYIGDGNNVSNSLMMLGAKLGVDVTVITPEGFEPSVEAVQQAQLIAQNSGAQIAVSTSLSEAEGATALYADTWVSMGAEQQLSDIQKQFADYQINQQLMDKTGASYFMHCQPAYREVEVSTEVLEGKQAIVMRQAENRMWAQNAVLMTLLGQTHN